MKALFFFIISLIFVNLYAENIKIGYVEVDEVIEKSSLYNTANNQLFIEFEPRKKQLLFLYDEIDKLLRSTGQESHSSSEDGRTGESVARARRGTMMAAKSLLRSCGAVAPASVVIIELAALGGRAVLDMPLIALKIYDD